MRFTTALFGLFAASVVVASPIAPMGATSEILERQVSLCSVGLPCWMQAQVNATLSLMASAVLYVQETKDNINVPVSDICASLYQTQTVILSATANANATLSAMATADAATVSGQVVAAITGIISTCYSDANSIVAQATSISVQITTAAQAVLSAIITLENVVGKCTS